MELDGVTLEQALAAYATAVRASPHNLLSRRGLEELESRHIPESLALARRLPPGPAALVDIGSGAGLPGLVIALARPDLRVALVEATTKKARFLVATARQLDLDVTVMAKRAEEVARGPHGASFDIATARAVAPLVRLVPLALPLVRPGGRLYAVKGARWSEELAAAEAVISAHGAIVEEVPSRGDLTVGSAEPPPRLVIIRRA